MFLQPTLDLCCSFCMLSSKTGIGEASFVSSLVTMVFDVKTFDHCLGKRACLLMTSLIASVVSNDIFSVYTCRNSIHGLWNLTQTFYITCTLPGRSMILQ
jgi:hypothetical protein